MGPRGLQGGYREVPGAGYSPGIGVAGAAQDVLALLRSGGGEI